SSSPQPGSIACAAFRFVRARSPRRSAPWWTPEAAPRDRAAAGHGRRRHPRAARLARRRERAAVDGRRGRSPRRSRAEARRLDGDAVREGRPWHTGAVGPDLEARGPRPLPPRSEPDDHRRRDDPRGPGALLPLVGDRDRAGGVRARQRDLLPARRGARPSSSLRPGVRGIPHPRSALASPGAPVMLLYDSPVSGNCYKVRLLLAHLGIPYERQTVDVIDRSNRPELLGKLTPGLRVPTLVLDDGRPLAESGAILWYFGEGTRFVPDDPYFRAQVLQWMFFEQYDLEPAIAVVRFWVAYSGRAEVFEPERPAKGKAGERGLRTLDEHLNGRDYAVGDSFTLADIPLYGYTHA